MQIQIYHFLFKYKYAESNTKTEINTLNQVEMYRIQYTGEIRYNFFWIKYK